MTTIPTIVVKSATEIYVNGALHTSIVDVIKNRPEIVPQLHAAFVDYDAQRSAALADANAAIAKHVDVLTKHHEKLPLEVQTSLTELAKPFVERRKAHIQKQIDALQKQIA